jgi:hypothetical protein
LDWARGKGRLCIPISHKPLLMWYSKSHYVPLNSVRMQDLKHEGKIACTIIWLKKIKEVCYSDDTSLSTVHWWLVVFWTFAMQTVKPPPGIKKLVCYTPIKCA